MPNADLVKQITQSLRDIKHNLLCLDCRPASVASMEIDELLASTVAMEDHLKESEVEITRAKN